MVFQYLDALRETGVTVTGSIVVSTSNGVLDAVRPEALKKNGGHLELKDSWGYEVLRRHQWVWPASWLASWAGNWPEGSAAAAPVGVANEDRRAPPLA